MKAASAQLEKGRNSHIRSTWQLFGNFEKKP